MLTIDYHELLIEDLKDPEYAAGYLDAVLEEGDIDAFLLALRNVIEAKGGMAKFAKKAKKNRTTLYKTLSENKKPYITNINDILFSTGLRLSVTAA